MLAALHIRNVVLIDGLTVAFSKGFCALTGETGAGKSILLDALGLALGARAEAGLVRRGAEQAQVSAEFHVEGDHLALDLMRETGIEPDAAIILRRTLGTDGRSRAFINDQPVSIGLLKQVGTALVEIHGQFETQSLLDVKTHGALLDEYGGVDGQALESAWGQWKEKERALVDAVEQARRAKEEEDRLRAAVEELEEIDPQTGEEEYLAGLRDRLMRRDQVMQNLSAAQEGIGGAESILASVWRALEKAGAGVEEARAAIDRAMAELQEASAQVGKSTADLEDESHSLPGVDDRLFALRGLARRHGCAPDDLSRLRTEMAERLSLIGRQEQVLDEFRGAVNAARRTYIDAAEKAGALRRKAAEKLDRLVAKELPPLKLEKARFVTVIDDLPESEWGPAGRERVRFLVATNPGTEPGPLDKIASGGEMARFMLALKVVMASVGSAGTLVFDEVDSGIGGATAAAVGERLARLAKDRQILVVTHSPQVAARAAHHWIVLKDGGKNVTTKILPLAEAVKRQEEIARMLSGAAVTDEARAAAGKLMEAVS